VTRTFYDSLGRKVETRTTAADPSLDMVSFIVYNDSNHSVFESVSFEVQSSLDNGGWVDPNGAVDYQNIAPGGTITYFDALGRSTGLQDPLYGSQQEPGISCPGLQGTWTACTFYGLGSANGDSAMYFYAAVLDPNNHGTVSFSDALGRLRYTQNYSGTGLSSISTNINMVKAVQYNVLDEATSVTTTDLMPQPGQSITSISTSDTYDDLGQLLTENDPDKGNHTYTYDANGNMLSDVSGTRTLGYNYDLLERIGCVQDASPTINATGACTNGTHPYVQNTYDTTTLGTKGSTDFPVGELTQSVATTYFPDGTQAAVTEQMQHDQRGRITNEHLQFTLPGSWNVTSALPVYQIVMSYNDADQLTTTTTSTNPSGQGYTTTQVYNSTSGMLTGLSNNGNNTANLATVSYNARGLEDTISFQTTTGSQLASEQFGYDSNLRPTSSTAIWQAGSGQSGTIFSQSRSYDPASNVISISTTQAAVPGHSGSGGSDTQNFCYNEQNQLVWAGNSGTQPPAGNGTCGTGTLSNSLNGANYNNSYVYTHLGQLWQGPLMGGSTQYQYLYCSSSHPHQLTGLYPIGTTCSNKTGQVYTSSYDNWGNVTSRFFSGTSGTLSYDGLDHFVQWNAGSNNQEWYVYDASGNRVLKRSINSSSTTMIVYAFGLEEHNYSGSGTNQWNTYYYSLGGRPLGEMNANGTYFFLTDPLGSILASFSNSAGGASIQGNQVFGPYGNNQYYQGNISTARGFTGQYNDALTGLDYYNARYYDPAVGRFLSADTVEGNPQGMDPYAYVSDNPETLSDPTGNCGFGSWGDFGDCFSKIGETIQNEAQTDASWFHDVFTGNFEGAAADTYNFVVNPWRIFHNEQVFTEQQSQIQVIKPAVHAIIKWAVGVIVTAAVAVGLGKLIGGAARSAGRSDQKIAEKLSDKTRTQWKRQTNSDDSKNSGGGYLQILGPNGKPLLDGQYSYDDPNSPFLSPGKNPGHTEEQIINWAIKIIQKYKAGLANGGTIKLLIFTRKPPCSSCQTALQGEWLTELKQAAGNSNVNIELTVWYQAPKGPEGTVKQWIP
jgi:RHS repeat-associated protein